MKKVLVQSYDPDQGSRLHDFFIRTIDKTGVSCDNLVRLRRVAAVSKRLALLLCQGSFVGCAFAYLTSSTWFFAICFVVGILLANKAKDEPPLETGHGPIAWSDKVARLLDRPFDKKG